jgi:uncharacterized protein YndB with AHSA1/START domain
VPAALQLHLIIDNYATHKTPAIQRWLLRHPRFHLALHADRRFVAQPGRALVRGADRKTASARRSPQHARTRGRPSAATWRSATVIPNPSSGPRQLTKSSNLLLDFVNVLQTQDTSAPDGYECSVCDLETTPGGRWRVTLRGSDGSAVAASGVYRIVDAPRRMVFTWAWEDENGMRGHETEVDVIFEATPGGTRLMLRQQRFESRQARDRHDIGWSASFDRLAKIIG